MPDPRVTSRNLDNRKLALSAKTPDQPRLMTAEEVADRLQVTVAWVREMARRGEMPSLKLGRYRRFSAEAIDVWLQDRAKATYKRRT